jgi:Zn-finger nucleic acid-binding protein
MNKEVIFNVVIGRCPSCKGVWLDGGELDLVKKGIAAGAGGDFATGLVLGMAIG